MRPPRSEGWSAEDVDRLPEAPRHTELIDGALVFERPVPFPVGLGPDSLTP